MATVYLAHDRKHHRSVAIKVLKPELAAALGPERFLREIETVARLNHPHILPLLDSGEADHCLYYVMPYVEGETLRERLVRERQLPVQDALQIAREVADALSYAHSHDVVHRDIKPENILFQAGHAVVSDFGIARAISAAAGHKLTETGIAVGTPAYMSPEQASGEVRLDGRSDVYGLACVVYEMLGGHPPFLGATVQEVVARHALDPVPPLRTARPGVPSSVEEAVEKALAKVAADRFPTATQFAEALSIRLPPAPFGLLHPVRLLGLFAAGALGVLAAVDFLMLRLGLPNWVFASAATLLIVGLPLMLVTAVFERQRVLARIAGTAVAVPQGVRGWFTWRRWLLGGAAALVGLGIATAAYTAMRSLGIGPVGTLMGSGVLQARQPLLVASFENRTTDSTLGPALSEALWVDLSQSPTVRLLDAQAVGDALRRMRRVPGTPLDLALARELARREGVKAVVTGEIDPVGQGYQLAASLVTAADGRVLTAVRETAADDRALIGAIDRLSKKLRERIGESLTTIRATEPLDQVTTGSLEALRRYTQALHAEGAGDYDRAAALYQEATALDTGFAMAYRKLAVVLEHSGASRDRSVAAATKAFVLRDRLPEVERYLAIALHYSTVDYDRTRTVAAYRSVLERDPDNTIALNNLSAKLYAMRQFREAESLAVRLTVLGSAAHFGVMAAQVGQGHFAAAETTLARFARVAPHDPQVPWARAYFASAQGAYLAAELAARTLRDEYRSSLTHTNYAMFTLAAVDAVQGKLSRAEREYEDLMALNEPRGRLRWYLLDALAIAQIDLRFRNQPAEGFRRIEAALRRHPLATIPPLDRPYVLLSRYYARAGRLEEATRWLAEYERTLPEGIRRGEGERHGAEGDVLLARGQIADAVARYQAWYDEDTCGNCFYDNGGLFEIATAYERAHTPDSALTYYERFVTTPSLSRVFGDALMLAPTYKRLGELYETRGDGTKAREYYGRFVDLWRDADPELQPMVRDVRARLTRLVGEH